MNHFQRIPYYALGLAAAIPGLALAQEGTGRTLEEIIVTAQKVSESIQDVPISVAVATEKDIKDINAFDFKDLQEITPGVTFGGGAGLQSAAIAIRGVGPEFFALGAPQAVAVYVDGVGQSQIGAVFSTMVDIARVELLRGPQGTLYGLNAPGGAYNITTKAPSFDGVNGYIEGSYSLYDSSDMATTDVRGAINIPLIDDTLAWRIAGVYSDSDGYAKMASPLATQDATGGHENEAIRSKLLWNPNDTMDLLWVVNYSDLEQNPAGVNIDGLVPGTGGTAISPVPAIYNEFEDNRNWGENPSVVTGEIMDTSLHFGWDTDLFRVDLIGFYQEYDTASDEVREPWPGGAGSVFQIVADSTISTLELRFSDSSDTLDYVAGLYYFDNEIKTTTFVIEQGVDVNGDAVGTTEGYAAFANVNFHLAEKWDLAAGLRYDDIETAIDTATTFVGVTAALDDELSFDHVSWSLKLRNYINDDLTAYLAIDNAFKQGGFNGLVAGVSALNEGFGLAIPPAVAQAAEDNLTYDEEISTAVELGLKGNFLDGRLRAGVAVFYQEYEDHQVAQTNQGTEALGGIFGSFFLAAISNAEEVTTYGIEFDGTYLMGDYWDVAVRAAYSKPEVEEWSKRLCPRGEESSPDQLYCPKGDGDSLNNLPYWNTNMQLGYARPVNSAWDFYSRASWSWRDEPNDTRFTDEYAESKSTIGVSVGVSAASLGLDIRAWGKNLSETDNNVDPGVRKNGDDALPGAYRGSFTPGRQYGVTVRYDF